MVDDQNQPTDWVKYFVYRQMTLLSLRSIYRTTFQLLDRTILLQQAIGTAWFWAANIHDQLHASGHGENAVTWLGGGLVFLSLTAYLQWQVVCQRPTRHNKLLLTIQIASAIGNATAFSIFVYRRFSWSLGDTACVFFVLASMPIVCIWYCRRQKLKMTGWRQYLKYFIAASWVTALLAIEMRSVPRLFQGFTLFFNNPLSLGTILSGCYIASVRLWAVGSVVRRTPSTAARHAFRAELFGNMGSQIILSAGWLLAVVIH